MFDSKKINGNLVFYSDLLPGLEHFFTTRGADVESFATYLKLEKKNIIHPIQTHSSNIDFAKLGVVDYPDTDALILANSQQAVYLRFADCSPVILYDKKANIAAIAHAGWKGTVASIAPKTVMKMLEYSNSDINDIYAVVGPAIGICCYKVGDDVVNGIKRSVLKSDDLILERDDGIYVDLKNTNARQLREMGVPDSNIDVCRLCTSCNNDLFYSYRKENGTQNRHYALVRLK